MDQLIFASLSHTHYWYEVGMLKVPVGGFGTVEVDLDQPGTMTKPVKIVSVAYVPGFSWNLLSTRKPVE